MARVLPVILLMILLSCKSKTGLDSDEASYGNFAETFKKIELPFVVSDTTMEKVADSTTISRLALRRFVPDSVLAKFFGKDTTYQIRTVGSPEEKAPEDYFIIHTKAKKKAGIFLLVFANDSFRAAMPMITTRNDKEFQTVTFDNKHSVTVNRQWYKGNELMYDRTVYAYNTAGLFSTVLTETNVPPVLTQDSVLNPIDTFPQQNQYSGDYWKGPKNFISIRDGNQPDTYHFFVHFLRDGENACGGDLKGELAMTSKNTGIYNSSNDPCVIDFKFGKNSVTVKEQGSCGNHRGITCFFDDTFTRKR